MDPGERRYKNDEITVFWKSSSCIHASTCITELPSVFRSDKKPWVKMGGASTDEIIKVVNKCPVDALTWKYNDDSLNKDIGDDQTNHVRNRRSKLLEEDFDEPVKASISVMKEGPYVVNGSFFIERENGNRSKFNGTVSLCRCGKSSISPFCDGSHRG